MDNNDTRKKKRHIQSSSSTLLTKYSRGSTNFVDNGVKNKKLKKMLISAQNNVIEAAIASADAEILLPADKGFIELDGLRKTYKLSQNEIKANVDINTAKNAIELTLPNFGPYSINYTRNGRFMIMAGRRGHVATMDCMQMNLGTELQLQESVYDAHYLNNEGLFAVAQEKYTYIYDSKGVEIHCMKRHERPYRLDYLPYHFLLVTVGHSGWVKWHDISTGEFVAGYGTGHGPCHVLRHNPTNGVSHVGHTNGVVSLWSPSAGKPLVTMFCHKSPITDLAIDRDGRYMATAGMDGFMKVWDLRKFTQIHAYKTQKPVLSLDISDTGLLALGMGREVQVLKDAFLQPVDITYLRHTITTPNPALMSGGNVTARVQALASSVAVHSVRYRPLEDILGVGHSHGISTLIIPGAGEANFDSFENNPFLNLKQRRETEIQSLINKLSHEMIGLDASFVGSVDPNTEQLIQERKEIFETANANVLQNKISKNKMRGKNKISAKLKRKQKNVIDAQTLKLREKLQLQKEERKKLQESVHQSTTEESQGALARFF